MINRELRDIKIYSCDNTPDAYGQMGKASAVYRTIKGVVKVISRASVNDPRYLDIDIIVLTKDNSVVDSELVDIDTIKYQIEQIIPAYGVVGYTQLLCKKLK